MLWWRATVRTEGEERMMMARRMRVVRRVPALRTATWYRPLRTDPVPYLVALASFILFTAFSLHQWASFQTSSWDLGIFTQLAQRYAHLETPIVDIKGPGFNLWGDHFHPILVVLGPIFALWPSGATLLIVQNALFAVSAIPLTRLARARCGSGAGVAFGLIYAVSWGLSAAVAAQFHEIAFAVPLLAFGLTAWVEGRYRRAVIPLGMLVFVKEDLGLTLVAFGAAALLAEFFAHGHAGRCAAVRNDDGAATAAQTRTARARAVWASPAGRWAAGLAVWGALWFVLSIWVLLPAFNPDGAWDYTDRLAGDAGLFTGAHTKLVTLAVLLGTAGVVGLASPWILLMLPTLAWRFTGNVEHYWGLGWHYSAVLMPIATIALLDGLGRLGRSAKLRELAEHAKNTEHGKNGRRSGYSTRGGHLKRGLIVFALVASAIATLVGTRANAVGWWLQGRYGGAAAEERAGAREALAAVPDGSHVVTDIYMLAYLVPNNTVYWEGTRGNAGANAVVFAPQSGHGDAQQVLDWTSAHFGGTWHIASDKGGYVTVLPGEAPAREKGK
ncbi:MAG: DUF2079 domain-containing protein [Actinotignum sanguinis]|uniref:DUF2079 domain-containing protein n=1 Tax=Actinotignum sanguinis TaxID=1445614 RepID=UPI00237DF92F|nr:DUF2079 domain-containing protein [Actinotignum sanguinis]MDE1553587.1 DUF2079 domain-containing protein [Actinotignum sanguinis]MDE1565166.1 DUF2079 domain-containing protein [Actinotignum sanguinis]MDE1577638.1 DUF2079 domain-containing protein [Actinotignum sanguinis]MDE1642093.1 DUF2079 domain-containing protein [Actinotignum sanguinis]MDK8286227.1 DUF2079 domain-containing protein [Actinotignum sanguinis]